MGYRYLKTGEIFREIDGATIPPTNSAYASLIASGEEILPYEEPESAPSPPSRLDVIEDLLVSKGVLRKADIDAAVEAATVEVADVKVR